MTKVLGREGTEIVGHVGLCAQIAGHFVAPGFRLGYLGSSLLIHFLDAHGNKHRSLVRRKTRFQFLERDHWQTLESSLCNI